MKVKLLAGCIAIVVIVYFLPIPVSQTESIVVHVHYDKVLEQINNLTAWKNWWPGSTKPVTIGDTVFQTPVVTYIILHKQPMGLLLKQDNQPVYNSISVVPQTGDTLTVVQWKQISYLRTAFRQMVGSVFFDQPYSAKNLLHNLKEHMEDPVKYYGYDIRIEPIEDTIILVNRMWCDKSAIPACLRKAFNQLQLQLDAAHYRGRSTQMFHIDSSAADSVQIMTGLSITEQLAAKPPFQIMSMPKLHIIVGYFEGNYTDIGRLHDAIILYMKNNKIGRAAVPYEKVTSNPQTAADSLHVKAKVYHPAMIL